MMILTSCDPAENERNLIIEAQRGSRDAMEALLVRHRMLIHKLAHRLCAGAGHAIHQDLVQAGNIGLMHAVKRYLPEDYHVHLITYAVPWILGEMKRVLRNIDHGWISFEAQQKKEEGLSLLDVLSGSGGISITHLDLRIALQTLACDDLRLICLRYYRGMTQKEAAVLMGKSQAQISRMEHRVLDALRLYLS